MPSEMDLRRAPRRQEVPVDPWLAAPEAAVNRRRASPATGALDGRATRVDAEVPPGVPCRSLAKLLRAPEATCARACGRTCVQ